MQEETVQPKSEKSLEELLAEAHAQIEQQRDTMLRAVADAENARKRAQTEATSSRKYAVERFAEALLPVVDSLEAALKSGTLGGDLSGVELTLKQLQSALEKSSIRDIDPKPGERFDPHSHQAMAAVEPPPGEIREPNTIVAVMQKGYRLHERVLRPALVTVAKSQSGPISNNDVD